MENRPELRSLDMAQRIGKHKVTIARSEFMPNVALTGGYLTSNPSLTNGFQKKFNGLWNVGVVVKIPILTWGERRHKVQAAAARPPLPRISSRRRPRRSSCR